MVLISPALDLPQDVLSLFYTLDSALSNAPILIFYGRSTTAIASAASNSRIQSHVLTPAGFQSYARLSVSPSSKLYAAVECLPREEQGDEVCRGLAFSLLKYFSELHEVAKDTWIQQSLSVKEVSTAFRLFSESHAASLASRMVKIEDAKTVIEQLSSALGECRLSCLDLDVILPPGTIRQLESNQEEHEDGDEPLRYGEYAPLIKLLGETAFIPTSRLRRAPSRATSVNRSRVLSRSQKENIRREMCELIDTEESYVSKMYDLVHSVAADFREKARSRPSSSSSPSESALECLFPPSLDAIAVANARFLDAVRTVVEETEVIAIEDIESNNFSHPNTDREKLSDQTGTLALAACLLEWFPKFKDCYGQYIQAHSQFSNNLKMFVKDAGSSFARRVEETGEQRLMSMLIEPVQRLPRYSLYIDNIIKQLPLRHAAIKPLLTAKDIVVDICSQDQSSSPNTKVLERLRCLVPSWSPDFTHDCRLISVTDAVEVRPPYQHIPHDDISAHRILLLFGGYLVTLQKSGQCTLSARSLLAEIDEPSSDGKHIHGLIFKDCISLADFEICEMSSNRMIRITPFCHSHPLAENNFKKAKKQNPLSETQVFYLKGVHESRASRWTSEIAKARVEGRFSEDERESWKWEVRALENGQVDLGFFSAIFEDGSANLIATRGQPALVKVVLDPNKGLKKYAAESQGSVVVISITSEGQGFFRVEMDVANERGTRDMVTTAEFIPVLVKRLGNFFQMSYQLRNTSMTESLLRYNGAILESLDSLSPSSPMTAKTESTLFRTRSLRPVSPVKMLSSFLSGHSTKESASPNKPLPDAPSSIRDMNKSLPILRGKSNSRQPSSEKTEENSKKTLVSSLGENFFKDPLLSLEETLSAYALALHARKGNIVGRVVSSRNVAEESAVNELYNSLLETPSNHELAAQVSVDVLFAAFEKFLKAAWLEKMGPVVSYQTLFDLQKKSEMLNPMDFDEYLSNTINDFAPQNQRALKLIIKLLVDLLDGTRNDGDRGALTVAIAEMIVVEGDAHDFLSLFDRLVADQDILLDTGVRGIGSTISIQSSTTSNTAASGHLGSVGSKASSLGKRFGFGSLQRSNSKNETVSRAGSILRGFSRSSKPNDSVSKTSLIRTKSFDLKGELAAQMRPGSQGSSIVSEGGLLLNQSTGLTENTNNPVGTPKIVTPSRSKKKRRSSLSDLKSLPVPDVSPFWTPSAFTDLQLSNSRNSAVQAPQVLSPPKAVPTAPSVLSNTASDSPKKENTSPAIQRFHQMNHQLNGKNLSGRPTSLIVNSHNSIKNSPPDQDIPRGVLSERLGSGNVQPPSFPPVENSNNRPNQPKSPQKLKMASPKKLKERLQVQQQAIEGAEDSLKAELDKIAEELSTFSSRPNSMLVRSGSPERRSHGSMANLNTRLKALEARCTHELRNLTESSAALEVDFRSSVQISDRRAQQYHQKLEIADAEREGLYQAHNEQLDKVFAQVKDGHGIDELKRLLRESQQDAAKWREECHRVVKENMMLKAQLGRE